MTADFFGGSDTGQNNPDSIAPVRLGEPASPGVLGRPSEILRERTVRLQAAVRELGWIMQTGGFSLASLDVSDPTTISWPGPYDGVDEALGRPTLVGDLVIFPRVGPGIARDEDASGDGTPWSSRRGELVWTFGASTLTLYAQPNEADGGAQVSIEVVVDPDATAITLVVQGSAPGDDEVSFVPGISHIKATVAPTTTVTQLSNALNIDSVIVAALVQTTVTGGGADYVTAKSRARILGTRAAIRLVLGDGTVDDFFDASDANLLREGDVLGLWAGSVADLMAQQLEDVSAVDVAWLVNMTRVPEAAGAAIPLARVIDGDLHLCSGVVVTTYPDPPPSGWTYPFTVDQGHADGLRTYPFDGTTFNLNERTVAGQLREIVGAIDDIAAGGLNFTRLAVHVPSGELPLSSERVRVSDSSNAVLRLQRTGALGGSASQNIADLDVYHYHSGSATHAGRMRVARAYDATYPLADTSEMTTVEFWNRNLSGATKVLSVVDKRVIADAFFASTRLEAPEWRAYANLGGTISSGEKVASFQARGYLSASYPVFGYHSPGTGNVTGELRYEVNADTDALDAVFITHASQRVLRVVAKAGLTINPEADVSPLGYSLGVCQADAEKINGGTLPGDTLYMVCVRREWQKTSLDKPVYSTGMGLRYQLPIYSAATSLGSFYPNADVLDVSMRWWDNTDDAANPDSGHATSQVSLTALQNGSTREVLRVFYGQWFISDDLGADGKGSDPALALDATSVPTRGTTLNISGAYATDGLARGVGIVLGNAAEDDVAFGRPMTVTFCGVTTGDLFPYELARLTVSNAASNASNGDREAEVTLHVHTDNGDDYATDGGEFKFRHDGVFTAAKAYAENLPASVVRVTDGSPPTYTSRGLTPLSVTRSATGVYVLTYADTQLAADPDVLVTPRGSLTPLIPMYTTDVSSGVVTVTVRLFDTAGVATNGNFSVMVHGEVTA